MTLSAAFRDSGAPDWAQARVLGERMIGHLSLLPPEEMEQRMRQTGFGEVALFYAALSFRGWVARAA